MQLPSLPPKLCFLYPASVPPQVVSKPPLQFHVVSHGSISIVAGFGGSTGRDHALARLSNQKGLEASRETGPSWPRALHGSQSQQQQCQGFA